MSVPTPSAHRLRLYQAAVDHARSLGDRNEAARWIVQHALLSLTDHPALPAAFRPPLVVASQKNAAANLLRTHRFQAIADALDGLRFAPLKGVHLLATVYRDDPENRVLTDLDLLVREEDAAAALDRLDALGYRESAASRQLAESLDGRSRERVLSDGGLTVEVHTRLGVSHGPESAWDDLRPVSGEVHGRRCHLLDSETTLVHLVTHFVRHGPFTRLGWVEDVARWCEAPSHRPGGSPVDRPPDPARAAEVARRLGAERAFAAGVRALAALLGDDFLAAVPRRDGDRLLRLHQRTVWSHLAGHPLLCGLASNPLRRNLSAVLLADRPGDAWRVMVSKGRELRQRWSPAS